jgi:hypothetical protein
MSDPMIPNQRADFSAIVDRPPLKLPGGARIVVWTIVNYEVWDISRPMARQVLPAPTGQPLLPDVPNWSWHEYGMRVGCWRFFDLYKRLNIRPTLSINARVCEDYPRVAGEARDLGWEFMGHAYEQGPIHKVEDQRGMIFKSLDGIEAFTGKRPVGWLGPGLTQTFETPDLLAEAGVSEDGRGEIRRRISAEPYPAFSRGWVSLPCNVTWMASRNAAWSEEAQSATRISASTFAAFPNTTMRSPTAIASSS